MEVIIINSIKHINGLNDEKQDSFSAFFEEELNVNCKKEKKKVNRYAKERKYKKKLKKMYEKHLRYPGAVRCIEQDMVKYPIKETYYQRIYKGRRWTYLKGQSNRKVRRYKGELKKGNYYRKLFDVRWEYD